MTPQIIINQEGEVVLQVQYNPVQSSTSNITGVLGPNNDAIVRVDGASGNVVQGSLAILDDSGNLTTPGQISASSMVSGGKPVALTSNANGDPNEISCYVKANNTDTFTAGQAVYISSVNGQNKIISKAQANSEVASSRTLGLLKQDLASNASGYVVTQGLLTDLDITAAGAVEGDPVWLSASVAGGLVFGEANKPSGPNHAVYLGVVVKKAGTKVQQIEVKVQNSFELRELSDIQLSTSTPPQNSFLLYNSPTGTWQNRTSAEVQAILSSVTVARTSYVETPIAYSGAAIAAIPASGSTAPYKGLISLLAATAADFVGFSFPITDSSYNVSSYQITLHAVVNKLTTSFVGNMTYTCTWLKTNSDFNINVADPSVTAVDSSGLPLGMSLVQITFPVITVPSGQAVKMPKFRITRSASPVITPASIQFGIIGATLTYS